MIPAERLAEIQRSVAGNIPGKIAGMRAALAGATTGCPDPQRTVLLTGRIVDGTTAASMGLVSLAVAPDELDATVDQIAAEVAAVPPHPQQLNKEALNTALEIMGVGAMFRYHGQMNALRRLG